MESHIFYSRHNTNTHLNLIYLLPLCADVTLMLCMIMKFFRIEMIYLRNERKKMLKEIIIRRKVETCFILSFSLPSTTETAYSLYSTAGEADIEDPRPDILCLFEKWSRTGWRAGEAVIWRRQSQTFSFINSFISRIWNVVTCSCNFYQFVLIIRLFSE